jgi:hypothetical protein
MSFEHGDIEAAVLAAIESESFQAPEYNQAAASAVVELLKARNVLAPAPPLYEAGGERRWTIGVDSRFYRVVKSGPRLDVGGPVEVVEASALAAALARAEKAEVDADAWRITAEEGADIVHEQAARLAELTEALEQIRALIEAERGKRREYADGQEPGAYTGYFNALDDIEPMIVPALAAVSGRSEATEDEASPAPLPSVSPAGTPDLMAALEQSLARARAERPASPSSEEGKA